MSGALQGLRGGVREFLMAFKEVSEHSQQVLAVFSSLNHLIHMMLVDRI